MAGFSPRHSVSVAAAVVREDGRVLVIQRRDNGKWEPPGGVLELEESIEAGLHRELREETGLEVEAEALTGVYKNMKQGVVELVFRCRLTGGAPAASAETTAFRWMTPDEVRNEMDKAYAVRLLDAFSAEPPHVRSHDGVLLL